MPSLFNIQIQWTAADDMNIWICHFMMDIKKKDSSWYISQQLSLHLLPAFILKKKKNVIHGPKVGLYSQDLRLSASE